MPTGTIVPTFNFLALYYKLGHALVPPSDTLWVYDAFSDVIIA